MTKPSDPRDIIQKGRVPVSEPAKPYGGQVPTGTPGTPPTTGSGGQKK